LKEREIRPQAVFEKFLNYLEEDIKTFFPNSGAGKKINCPACKSDKIKEKFTKKGFVYNWCAECRTIYASPRPPEKNFVSFYTDGKSVKYWATDFYKKTEKNRVDGIYKPRLKKIEDIFKNELNEKIEVLIDVGAGYGTFCELAKKSTYFNNIIAIEPSQVFFNSLELKKIRVIKKFIENITKDDFKGIVDRKKLFCAFELWEHLYDPVKFLTSVKNVMNKGDYLLITTLNILGFDLLILWKKSKSISPPQHINFFNLESLKLILEKNGFSVVKAFTPGELDVDIVRNMNISFDDHLCDYIINCSDDAFRKNLQDFISKNNLSSHMWVIAKL